MEEHPEDLKDLGNAALREGRFQDAINAYSRAIALDTTSHVYVHNRAIARLRMKDYAGALADANTAISNKRDYGKAYNTKGTALMELGRLSDAIEAFERGLDFDPANENLTANLRAARARQGGASAGSQAGSSPTSGSGSAGAGAATGARLIPTALMPRLILFGQLGILTAFITYVLTSFGPLGINATAYTGALILAAITHVSQMISRHGVPKLNAEYAQRLITDPSFHLCFLPLIFLMTRPMLLALVPAVSFDVLTALDWVYAAARTPAPAVASGMGGAALTVLKYLPHPAGSTWSQLSLRDRWNGVNERFLEINAMLEVMLGIMFVVELLTPYRSILAVVMLWQTLQLRYMMSDHTRRAFALIDSRITSLTEHRLCPRIVDTGYKAVRRFLRSQAKTPEDLQREAAAAQTGNAPSGGLAGMARNCVIM